MSPSLSADASSPARRQRWLSVLAKAPPARLSALWAELWDGLGAVPAYTLLRRPETGLVMVKGRISGSGAPFCAGEMTATRAAVRLATGEVGIGYVGGRSARHAEIAAAVDALGQRADWQERLETAIVAPLEAEAAARHQAIAARAAATKVDFFTVAREAGT
ncbi:MAG: phosphonate C-P lyase system protein PhnG [Reyranella sp.]|nr:phosphonate C-P lyase system protein PhnG [Reyranella sp.]MBL6653982.1 phosphonate C-P lyase system protein PhnG [Reyranella sp.]